MNAIGSEQGPRRTARSGASRGVIPALLCAGLVGCNSSHKAPTPVSSSHVASPPALAAASHLLGVGDPAAAVSVSVHTGMLARLQDLGPKPVAVFFCPSITAAVCTAPLLALRDNWLKLRPALGMVIAILGEDRTVLREYAYAQELPFLLSSGADGALAKAFGVGTQNSSTSQLFLISPAMKITARITDPGPQIVDDLQAALLPPAAP